MHAMQLEEPRPINGQNLMAVVGASPIEPPGDPRDALDDLITDLCAKRQRVSALRRSLPDDMLPEAVEALCNLGSAPGCAVTGGGLKFKLSETCAKIDADIERLCALRRCLPEDFADPLAEEGLAILAEQFCYQQ